MNHFEGGTQDLVIPGRILGEIDVRGFVGDRIGGTY